MKNGLETGIVVSQDKLVEGIYQLRVRCDAASSSHPGQFCNLYLADGVHMLPRPISIAEIDRTNGILTFCYRIAGEGTAKFATYSVGSEVQLMGPLGNGFKISEYKNPLLIGGGIGVFPMLSFCQELGKTCTIALGYKDEPLMLEAFEKATDKIIVATEDGRCGFKGNILDAIKEKGQSDYDSIFACGPKPMLKAVKKYAEDKDIPCFVSLEEKMACGIGACLACVCETKDIDSHFNVSKKRICKDGPVFRAEEVVL